MNRNNFIYKPISIVQDKRLTPLEQDYLCLIAQLEKAGGCTAGNKYFADYFKVSRPRAVEVITNLRKKGFIDSSEKKQGGKTIERKIWIVDSVSKDFLLTNGKDSLPMDSKKSPAGLVRKSGFDSKESPYHTIEIQQIKTTDKSFCPDSIEYGLAEILLNEILKRKTDLKKPNLQEWAKDIDKMIRLDNRKPEQIEKVIRWTQQDSFWQNNVLCTKKLRKQFDQLEMKMKQKPKQIIPQINFSEQKSAYGECMEV